MRFSHIVSFTVGAAVLTACSIPKAPPVAPPKAMRRPLVVYEKFRVKAMDFGWRHLDQTETDDEAKASPKPTQLVSAIPAALLTEMHATDRFGIYEQGSDKDPSVTDGYVTGTITSWNLTPEGGKICVDVRLANSFNNEVIYSTHACFAATISEREATLDREAIKGLAQELTRSVKRIGNAKVLSVEDRLLLINRGSEAGVKRGMVAFLRGTGALASDAQVHEGVTGYTGVAPPIATVDNQVSGSRLPAIVAELIIVTVDKDTSLGLLQNGSYALRGDAVFFK